MSIKLSLGKKKRTFKSIKEAADYAQVPYITIWMRVNKLNWPGSRAIKADVRQYNKREMVEA